MTDPRPQVDDGPAVDPTKNVLDLVAAAILRQDDLRSAIQQMFDVELKAVRELLDTKAAATQHEFSLIESRRVEQKTDTQVAVNAALSAAEKAVRESQLAFKEAISKSEMTSSEQTKQQNATFSAKLDGVIATLNDLKERFAAFEGKSLQVSDNSTANRLNLGMLIGLGSLIVAFIAVFFKAATQ